MTQKTIRSHINKLIVAGLVMFLANQAAVLANHILLQGHYQEIVAAMGRVRALTELNSQADALALRSSQIGAEDPADEDALRRKIRDLVQSTRAAAAESPQADSSLNDITGALDQAATRPDLGREGPAIPVDRVAIGDAAHRVEVWAVSEQLRVVQRLVGEGGALWSLRDEGHAGLATVPLALSWLVSFVLIQLAVRVRREAIRVEETIADSATRFRDFAHSSADIFWETDAKGVILDVAGAPGSSHIATLPELVGRPVREVFRAHDLQHPDAGEKLSDLIAGGKAFRNLAYAVRDADGNWLLREVSAVPVHGPDGTPKGMRGITRDVTERHVLAEQYGYLLRRVRAIAARWTGIRGRGRFHFVTDSIEEITGFTAQEAMAKDLSQFVHPADHEATYRDIVRSIRETHSFERKVRWRRKDGSTIWVIEKGVLVAEAPSGERTYEVIVLDITASVEAETRARQSEELLATVVKDLQAGVYSFIVREPGIYEVLYVSPQMRGILPLAPSSAGSVWNGRAVLDHEEAEELMVLDSRAFEMPCSFSLIRKISIADGSSRWVASHGNYSRDLEGRLRKEGIVLDITQRIVNERKARETDRLLAAISESVNIGFYSCKVVKPGVYTVNYVSASFCRIVGIAPDEAGRWLAAGGAAGKPTAAIIRQDQRAFEAPETFRFEWHQTGADGRRVWLATTGRYSRDEDGNLLKEGAVYDVTAQHEANERVADLAAALDKVEDGITVNDGQGRVQWANAAMLALLDIPAESDIVGRSALEFVTPQGHQSIADMHAEKTACQQAGRPWPFSIPATTQRRVRRHLEGTVTFIGPERTVTICRDVSARIAAETRKQSLARALARLARDEHVASGDRARSFRFISEVAGDALQVARAGIWLLSKDGRSLVCSDLFTPGDRAHEAGLEIAIKGHEVYFQKLQTERIIVANSAQEHEATACFTEGYLKPLGITSALKVPIRINDRTVGVVCCEHIGIPRTWTPEEVTFIMVVGDVVAHAIDAADRKDAQAQLEFELKKNRGIVAALDHATDAVAIFASGGALTYANPAMAELAGAPSRESLIGCVSQEVLLPRRRIVDGGDADGGPGLPTTQGTFDLDSDFRMFSGAIKPLTGKATALPDGGRILVMRDKSAQLIRERQEDELREQLSQARKMEAIGRLAGGIAHDFNNILGAIRSFADLIALETPEDGKSATYASRIVRACERATALVKQIMDYSRASMAEHAETDLRGIVEEMNALLVPRLPSGVLFDVAMPPGDLLVMGNSGQIMQVLLNLCVNAIDAADPRGGWIRLSATPFKAAAEDVDAYRPGLARLGDSPTPAGGPWRYVEGGLKVDMLYVCLKVSDAGSGIDPTLLDRIFEPFFTTKDKSDGTGLGLAVAASVVAAHHGCFAVTSESGKGSTFEIFLPMIVVERKEPLLTPPRPSLSVAGSERVMLIDDEIDLADSLAIALETMGYEVLPVYDPLEALDLFREDPSAWDIVVTDQVMPKMKGLSVIRELKKIDPLIRVILYTGYSDMATEVAARAAGAEGFAYKPIPAVELAALLRDVMGRPAMVPAAG